VEEGGHLPSVHSLAGAELGVGRWVAPFGDTCCSELVDVIFEHGAILVGEQVASAAVRVSLSFSKTESLSSEKWSIFTAGSAIALARNAAIMPRGATSALRHFSPDAPQLRLYRALRRA
jgi:hypothetical protein